MTLKEIIFSQKRIRVGTFEEDCKSLQYTASFDHKTHRKRRNKKCFNRKTEEFMTYRDLKSSSLYAIRYVELNRMSSLVSFYDSENIGNKQFGSENSGDEDTIKDVDGEHTDVLDGNSVTDNVHSDNVYREYKYDVGAFSVVKTAEIVQPSEFWIAEVVQANKNCYAIVVSIFVHWLRCYESSATLNAKYGPIHKNSKNGKQRDTRNDTIISHNDI